MSNISDDAWEGVLTAEHLQAYLAKDPNSLNNPSGKNNLTPLAAAVSRGRLEIVRLLLAQHAEPDALSPGNRTPLYFATTKSPDANRGAIVKALLEAGAEVDACSAADNYSTPLMNAIVELRDKDVIHELVDHGASVSKMKNTAGKTAVDLALERGLQRELRPKDERGTARAEIIDLLVALVLFIVAWANSDLITGVIGGVVKQLYGIGGSKDQELAKEIKTPDNPQEFVKDMDNYVKDVGLERFFAPGDPFLQQLGEKAATLKDDNTTALGSPENIQRLTRLSLYQPIIYCDDSGSMEANNRKDSQADLVSRIARITTKIVPDGHGVWLRFINYSASSLDNLSPTQIEEIVKKVQPSGGTPIGTNLARKILKPLVYDKISPAPGQSTAPGLDRPLLICTITDGQPGSESQDTLKNEIIKCRRELVKQGYEPTAVMFCVSQIGDDASARKFLNDLSQENEIADVLFVTTDQLDQQLKALRANDRRLEEWLLKLLTKPIMERND